MMNLQRKSVTPPPLKPSQNNGFTLIELSIVLVIIGLIIGGILVGQDLIKSAETRAQISQIDKYNTAVNTFLGKYSFLPGDIPDPNASNFGFSVRGPYRGQGDGNGLIESNYNNTTSGYCSQNASAGEGVMFWSDLSTAKYLDGSFSIATADVLPGNITPISSPNLNQYLPSAKVGHANYVYAWSYNGINWFGIAQVLVLGSGMIAVPQMSVQQAYQIDKKMDDGLPQSGHVQALYWSIEGTTNLFWAGGTDTGGVPFTTSTQGTATSCFDNASGSGAQQYSVEQNAGTGLNCTLSFQFQ